MNFELTKEQELVRQMVREFAVNEVKPIAAEIDETERFPMENVKKMGELRNDGYSIFKEFGGANGDILSYIISCRRIIKGLWNNWCYSFSSYFTLCFIN